MIKIFKTIAELTCDDVVTVYSGKDRHCRCGCGGIYRVTRANAEANGKRRGYECSPEEINDSFVARVLKAIQEAPADKLEVDDEFVNLSFPANRAYTLYVKPEIMIAD